jgi:hypothetical protein
MKFKKAETIEELFTNIKNRDYESLPCFLINDADFIRLEAEVKKLNIPVVVESLKDIYKQEFRIWVKDNYERHDNMYLSKAGDWCKERNLEAKYKTQILLYL